VALALPCLEHTWPFPWAVLKVLGLGLELSGLGLGLVTCGLIDITTVTNLCPQPKSLLIKWPSGGCLTNHYSDVASTHQHIAQNNLIDPLLWHCGDSAIYVLKSGMLECHRLGAMMEVQRLATKAHDGCAWTVHWPAVLLKLKLVRRL